MVSTSADPSLRCCDDGVTDERTMTVGNARIEGLLLDLSMTGEEYLTGLTLYFVGYVLFEVSLSCILHVSNP